MPKNALKLIYTTADDLNPALPIIRNMPEFAYCSLGSLLPSSEVLGFQGLGFRGLGESVHS